MTRDVLLRALDEACDHARQIQLLKRMGRR
jgi:hypothetical protein